jgi:hypothetical protein
MLHASLYALPDVTFAVDPRTLAILDVNRGRDALGYAREELGALGLDALLDAPRADVASFVAAASGQSLEVGVRLKGGVTARATAKAATSAAAAAQPCVLVVLREAGDAGLAPDDVERLRAALAAAQEVVGRLPRRAAEAPKPAAPPEPAAPTLSMEQYAALRAEEDVAPSRRGDIEARFGITSDAARARIDQAFRERIEGDAGVKAQWDALSAKYRRFFESQRRARSAPQLRGTALVAPGAQPAASLPFGPVDAPELTVEQYAAVLVELDAYPERRAETLRLHGIVTEATWKAVEAQWEAKLVAEPALQQRIGKLAADLRKRLVR